MSAPQPGLEPRPLDPDLSALTMKELQILCCSQASDEMAKPLFSFFCGNGYSKKNVIDLVNKYSDHESDR